MDQALDFFPAEKMKMHDFVLETCSDWKKLGTVSPIMILLKGSLVKGNAGQVGNNIGNNQIKKPAKQL